jgi:hypothetical protein
MAGNFLLKSFGSYLSTSAALAQGWITNPGPTTGSTASSGDAVAPTGAPNSGTTSITVNGAVPDIPGGRLAGILGFQHQWITTSNGQSAGIGNMQGVPGENGQTSSDLPLIPTQVVDHTGYVPQTTITINGVDRQALSEWLAPGRQTGPWIPFFNDCNTFVRNVIENSQPRMRSNRPWNPFENPMTTEVLQANPGRQTVIMPDGTVRVVTPSPSGSGGGGE